MEPDPLSSKTGEEIARDLQKFAHNNLTAIPGEPLSPSQIRQKLERELLPPEIEMVPQPPTEVPTEPVRAEPPTPHPAQTTVPEADRFAQASRAQGSQFPTGSLRPQPPSQIREEGSVIVAKALAEQLGTAPDIKGQMRIDERKLAVLSDPTLASLSHFSYRYVYDGVRYWGHITEWWLTGSQGIGGLGRRHILQAISSSSGVQSVEKAEKPNVLARNLWDRTWKQKAESQGKVVEE